MLPFPLSKPLYHFWSSAFVGLLVFLLMYLTEWPYSPMAQSGSTRLRWWRRLAIPLLCSVWAHILFDIPEHDGNLPNAIYGVTKAVEWLQTVF